MTGAALALAVPAREDEDPAEHAHVLEGVKLSGAAARLAAVLDPAFLAEARWDPKDRVLDLPAGHRLLGHRVCRVGGCPAKPLSRLPGVCYSCFGRLTGMGLGREEIAQAELPPLPVPVTVCAAPGCRCVPTVSQAILCEPHARQFRGRVRKQTIGQFLADPRVRPLPLRPRCPVAACVRFADGARGYCSTHYQRWRIAAMASPGLDEQWWQAREPAVAEPGLVSLRGLPRDPPTRSGTPAPGCPSTCWPSYSIIVT